MTATSVAPSRPPRVVKRIRPPLAWWVILVPLLIIAFGDFTPAYRVVAWVSWVPNFFWAEWYIRGTAHAPVPDAQTLRVA